MDEDTKEKHKRTVKKGCKSEIEWANTRHTYGASRSIARRSFTIDDGPKLTWVELNLDSYKKTKEAQNIKTSIKLLFSFINESQTI